MLNTIPHASSESSTRRGVFQTTLWSQVSRASRPGLPGAREALERLCLLYWPPVYSFLRRSGLDAAQAKDLTQGFFLFLIRGDLLSKADARLGRFRSFLLGSVKGFVANERAKERALKRGGGLEKLPLEEGLLHGAESFACAAASPDRIFMRHWAMAVVEEAMKRLATEYRRAGLDGDFDRLKHHLTGETDESMRDLAAKLGRSEGAARVQVCRLRNRFRHEIRAVIAETVADPFLVETELNELREALRAT